mgnify:FL=1
MSTEAEPPNSTSKATPIPPSTTESTPLPPIPQTAAKASKAKGDKKEPPPVIITLDALSKDPEDREMLVLGLQVCAEEGCVDEVRGVIPDEAKVEWPIAPN